MQFVLWCAGCPRADYRFLCGAKLTEIYPECAGGVAKVSTLGHKNTLMHKALQKIRTGLGAVVLKVQVQVQPHKYHNK